MKRSLLFLIIIITFTSSVDAGRLFKRRQRIQTRCVSMQQVQYIYPIPQYIYPTPQYTYPISKHMIPTKVVPAPIRIAPLLCPGVE
jgi:hypothetical protein